MTGHFLGFCCQDSREKSWAAESGQWQATQRVAFWKKSIPRNKNHKPQWQYNCIKNMLTSRMAPQKALSIFRFFPLVRWVDNFHFSGQSLLSCVLFLLAVFSPFFKDSLMDHTHWFSESFKCMIEKSRIQCNSNKNANKTLGQLLLKLMWKTWVDGKENMGKNRMRRQ